MHPRRNLAARAGAWSARHRRTAILGWLAFVAVAMVIGGATGTRHIKGSDQGTGQARQGDRIITAAGLANRATENVLIQGRDGRATVRDASFRAAIADVQHRVARNRYVVDVRSPLTGARGNVSRDGRSALVTFDLKGTDSQTEKRIDAILAQTAAAQRAHPALRIEEFGDASANKALNKSFNDDFHKAEMSSLPLTLIILVVAFGALVAAGLPLLLALSAVLGTLGILGPLSQLLPMDPAASSVVLLIGLAVGIDYSLFYLRREREERAAGRSAEAALQAAAATSGRAVLVSGFTVMIAMAGLFLTGHPTFTSFGLATMLVVAVAMIGSVTVLPALLSKLGDRVEKGRVPFLGRRRASADGGRVWSAIVGAVMRRPVVAAVLSGGVLVALAIPAFGLHTVQSGAQGIPRSLPIMRTYDRMQKAFPGGSMPAFVAIKAPDVTTPTVQGAIAQLRTKALATGEMDNPIQTTVSRDHTVVAVSIPLQGKGTDATSERALMTLRDDVVPATVGKLAHVQVAVTGMTAGSHDFNALMKSRAPLVFAFVLGLAFLLLMVTFRSIVIPLKAIVLNLLSVGAAYGLLVLVFQDGHGEKLLGFHSIGGITAWLPLFLFVILFGLSMDYHVFILSRIREGYDRGMRTADAVAHGIRSTAGTVTSAAMVMVAAFAIFGTLGALDFKEMGVGMGAAVLIDATIVRAVLLPATMKLLGDWNWYLPRWLRWLPKVGVESDAPALAPTLREPEPEPIAA